MEIRAVTAATRAGHQVETSPPLLKAPAVPYRYQHRHTPVGYYQQVLCGVIELMIASFLLNFTSASR